MQANIFLIIVGMLMVLSFSIGHNGEAASREEVMQMIDAGGSETLLEGY